MKWEDYSKKFEETALKNGFFKAEIDEFLNYAQGLFDRKLPIIYDQRHLALLVGYREELLRKLSNSPKNFYRTFTITKKNGGERIISEPLPTLKEIQYWILENILYKCKISGYAKGFRQKYSIKDNSRFHINKEILLTIDIKDFFPSLKFPYVLKFFKGIGYSYPVSVMLSNLCCLNNGLPQGAPTSPALSNLLMVDIDKAISEYILENRIYYTSNCVNCQEETDSGVREFRIIEFR